MRILLIAYEFPPGPSPQSLRWARLSRELARRGAQVRVLTVQREGEQVRLPAPAGLVIDRTAPGAASGLLAHVRSAHVSERTSAQDGGRLSPTLAEPMISSGSVQDARLNWKGRLVERMNRLIGWFTFPDTFGQWELAARLRLRQLLEEFRPDVVISSHEPPTTLRLGRVACERGVPWLADLGDPVESSYTPVRWRRRARRLEAWTCRHASHVTVTTVATKQLLVARHGVGADRISVLPQGYDPPGASDPSAPPVDFQEGMLELVYTGSFYAFRRPRSLVDAVLGREDARLTVASRAPPQWLRDVSASHPGKVRLLGFVGHVESLALQRSADVLVNIANDDQVQVPGKLFEYIGASRPILHIGDGGEVVNMLRDRGRGLVVVDSAEAVDEALGALWRIKAADAWPTHFDLRDDLFPEYRWESIGGRLFDLVEAVAAAQARPGP